MSIWTSPIFRQCFATLGVALNFSTVSLAISCATGLLEQLQRPDSLIPIDDSLGSWVAALPAISSLISNIIAIPIVSRFGRKKNNLFSAILMAIGFICMYFCNSITTLLICRFIQGLGYGLIIAFGPLLIGEYSSPRYRGVLLMTNPVGAAVTGLVIHQMELNLNWQIVSLICGAYSVISTIIIALSPESPSWLISKGRYEEGRTVFRWLRGEHEEEELERIIEADVEFVKTTRDSFRKLSMMRRLYNYINDFRSTLVKKEFYKPIIVQAHLFIAMEWCGFNIFSSYADVIFRKLDLGNFSMPVIVLIMGIIRIIMIFVATYIINRWNRRVIFFSSAGSNILMLLLTAAYTYASESNMLPFQHPAIYVVLNVVLLISYLLGSCPICMVVLGEIFPLEYRNLAGTISMVFCSINGFLAMKTFPDCVAHFELYGTYCICAAILTYSTVVVWFTMPETKDRTLQDIEDEFRGRSARPGQARPLTSWENADGESTKDSGARHML